MSECQNTTGGTLTGDDLCVYCCIDLLLFKLYGFNYWFHKNVSKPLAGVLTRLCTKLR